MSKGSQRRPSKVSDDQVKANWDAIFKTSVGEVVQDREMEEAETGTTEQAPILPVSPPPGPEDTGQCSRSHQGTQRRQQAILEPDELANTYSTVP